MAILGRLGLDWLVTAMPSWATQIERFGGWVLGMIIGVVVILPIFRMYSVFGRGDTGSGSDRGTRA